MANALPPWPVLACEDCLTKTVFFGSTTRVFFRFLGMGFASSFEDFDVNRIARQDIAGIRRCCCHLMDLQDDIVVFAYFVTVAFDIGALHSRGKPPDLFASILCGAAEKKHGI